MRGGVASVVLAEAAVGVAGFFFFFFLIKEVGVHEAVVIGYRGEVWMLIVIQR